ncbi:phytoene desaturase [Aliidiomarina iranensis]|uniref:Phytoene desaturase n=1 Tax=Aliidiomarina iranensis TaxID=1434071 RepID=A0A432W212_9GAMM|nr:phytoene desaturase family protein [Aliidiomarina iranensis]RUO23270.1 phytoene desaturase [Aliidiomarina iranensis]
MHTVVIGSGFGGIAAALRARAKGHEVTLVEKNSAIGGRAQVFEREGFKFDAGPTVITAPFLFDELFALFNKRREDYVEFVALDIWYQFYFSNDQTRFNYGGSVEDTLAEIDKIEPADKENYKNLIAHSKRIYDIGFEQLSDQPFHKLSTMIGQISHLGRLRADQTVWQMVSKHLKNDKLRQAFSIQPLLVGGNPFNTTSIYGLIHYLEREYGIHFAMGGTGAIIAALEKLMLEEGVKIVKDTEVTGFTTEGKRIVNAQIKDNESLAADYFIFNGDPLFLYKHLLPDAFKSLQLKLKVNYSKRSMGLYVLFFGTKKQYPDVEHHTIWLGKRYQALLAEIFAEKEMPADFSLYLHRPTATDPSFAPEGCDSFYVLAPVPNLRADIDWETEEPKLRARIIKALNDTLLPGLEENITAVFAMTPNDFKNDYRSVDGAGFSIAPTLTQSAWFRFHNQSEYYTNLLLSGAGTHPGAGMPGVLCAAKVVEKLLPKATA